MEIQVLADGKWSQADVCDWPDGENAELAWRKLVGLDLITSIGQEYEERASLYRRSDGGAWPARWCVEVFLAGGDFAVLVAVDDFGEMLAFWAEATKQAGILDAITALENLSRLAEKAFHAWHGHGTGGVCMECDPDEARRRTELRNKRIAEKAAQAAKSK